MNDSLIRRYADRIERVLRHLETWRGEAPPPVAELARVAAISEFHFQRVYRLMTGETIGETLRRVRLSQAVPLLRENSSITAAAGASGYGTPQGFARALRAQTGQSPTQARQSPDALEAALRRARPGKGGDAQTPALTVDITSVSPLRLLAIHSTGAYRELDKVFGRLFEQVLEQLSPESILGLHGLWFDDPREVPDAQCRSWCALDTGGAGAAVADLEWLVIEGGVCLRLRHSGDYNGIPESMDALYAAAIASEERLIGSTAPFIHFLDDPEQVSVDSLRADLFLPIEDSGSV